MDTDKGFGQTQAAVGAQVSKMEQTDSRLANLISRAADNANMASHIRLRLERLVDALDPAPKDANKTMGREIGGASGLHSLDVAISDTNEYLNEIDRRIESLYELIGL